MNRIVAFILSVVAIGLAADWMLETAEPTSSARSTLNDPDVYMLNASVHQYDGEGQLQHHIEASRFTHFPLTNVTTLLAPSMLLATTPDLPWEVTASEGRMLSPSQYREKIFELWDDVLAVKGEGRRQEHEAKEGEAAGEGNGNPFTNTKTVSIKTQSLLIYPDRSYAETSEAVTIENQYGTTRAASMQAFLDQGRHVFLSDERERVATVLNPPSSDFSPGPSQNALRKAKAQTGGQDSERPIHIKADRVVMDDLRGTSVYRGEVIITQGTLKVTADEMEVVSEGSGISQIVAKAGRGGSRLAHYEQRAQDSDGMIYADAEQIVYWVGDERLQLSGNARLQQVGDVFAGESLDYDMNRGIVNISSPSPGERVKMIINPGF